MFRIIASASEREGRDGVSSTCLLVAAPIGFGGGPCRSQAPSVTKNRSPIVKPILKCVIGVASQSCVPNPTHSTWLRHTGLCQAESVPGLAFSGVIDSDNFGETRGSRKKKFPTLLGLSGLHLFERQDQTERCTYADSALDVDVASMGIDHIFHDLGPESCSAGFSADGTSGE